MSHALNARNNADQCNADLFERPEILPKEVQTILRTHGQDADLDDEPHDLCESLLRMLLPLGFTFDYGKEGMPHGLRACGADLDRSGGLLL